MSISPTSNIAYKYDFYLQVFDENNVRKIIKEYSGTNTNTISLSYTLDNNILNPGVYNIKLLSSDGSRVLDTAQLTINAILPYSTYSVSVNDINMNRGSSGSIYMSILPASSNYYYKYDFYLKIYDSNGIEKISKRYYSNQTSNSLTYTIDAVTLDPGKFTIKIINVNDNHIFDTAELNINSIPYSAYNVTVDDTNIDYWPDSDIHMSILPASSNYYYKYDFYLKIYDSNGIEKISKRYYSNQASNSLKYTIKATTLNPSNYTVKIINTYDCGVMNISTLIVNSLSYASAYSVRIDAVELYSGIDGYIYMCISPADSKYYQNDFYLEIHDDNNPLKKISERFYSETVDSSSKTLKYKVNANSLACGEYTLKIINVEYNELIDTAFLTISNLIPTIFTSTIIKDENNHDWLIVGLKDYLGNPIQGVNLSTTEDFNNYNFPTNEYGLVTLITDKMVKLNSLFLIIILANGRYL